MVILDLYSRKVVDWSIDRQMSARLACDALRMALAQRPPPSRLLLRSGQGCQYASEAWQRLLADHRIRASTSRWGTCWNSAVVARFFLNLKMERVWQRRYANHGEAGRDIAGYIIGFYNATRVHSTLGYVPTNVYERQQAAEPPEAVFGISSPLYSGAHEGLSTG